MNKILTRLEVFLADNLLLSVALLFMPILYGVGAFGLITQIGLGRWVFSSAVLLFVLLIVVLHRGEGFRKLLSTLSLFFFIFALLSLCLSMVFDIGYDSRVYHAGAILSLLDGFNPFHSPLEWDNYTYPAGHWLMSSSFILWTNSFEASFVFTAIAIFGAFISSWRFIAFRLNISRGWRLTLSALLALNPTSVANLFSHQIDGLFASVLLSVFMLLLSFISRGVGILPEDRKDLKDTLAGSLYAFYIIALLVLLLNLKFSGFAHGGILGFVALCYGLTRTRTVELGKRLFRYVCIGSAGVFLGIFLFGFFLTLRV